MWEILLKLDPALKKAYKRLLNRRTPGSRQIEYPWIITRISPREGRALDFGCAGPGYLSLVAAERGFHVMSLDRLPLDWPFDHPRIQKVTADILSISLGSESFDLIFNCSTMEHVGLGRYGGVVDEDGDLRVMAVLRDLLKRQGVMLLTVPVGVDMVSRSWDRVYGPQRLPRLLDGFVLQEEQYWTKDRLNRWQEADRRHALQTRHTYTDYALGCFTLTRSR